MSSRLSRTPLRLCTLGTFHQVPGFLSIPTFYAFETRGVLWHAHKDCPGTPENYAFPASPPLQIRDDLRRVTMACQYGFK